MKTSDSEKQLPAPGRTVGRWQSALARLLKFIRPRSRDGAADALLGEVTEKQTPQKRLWRMLQVEAAFACNLRCVMCPWREMAKGAANQGIMSQEIWQAIRPYLSEAQSVDFTGGGEPLLQPRLARWIAEAKAAGCETGFLSNGLLLNQEKLEKILEAGLNWICISMDGATAEIYNQIRVGSNFERVCQNVANIARLRKNKLPKTMINFVLMKMNFHQMEEIVRVAGRLGVDQVNFKQCDVIRDQAGKGLGLFAPEETGEIRKLKKSLEKTRRLAKKLRIETTASPFMPRELTVCDQDPRDSLFIGYDGTVAPCISLALGGTTTFLGKEAIMSSVHYGRLPEDDLKDLWQTNTCRLYRQRFEERVRIHENTIMRNMLDSGGSGREKIFQAAREAMPEPPAGCNVCHYLYDI
jgi:MoaA/NifB/PqqE/SkfB family radical SAM enzyme